MKRKRQKETSHKQDEKFQESQGKHIVVVGFENDNIGNITIVDAEDEIFKGLINKTLFN